MGVVAAAAVISARTHFDPGIGSGIIGSKVSIGSKIPKDIVSYFAILNDAKYRGEKISFVPWATFRIGITSGFNLK